MVPFKSLGAVSYSPSIVTMALSCISSEIKPDIGRKSWFFIPPLHLVPPLGGFLSEYCHLVWYGKTRMVGLPDSEKTLRICVIVYTQYRRVTDGRTDILPRHSPRCAYASRGKNENFQKSKMADGGHFDNRYIAISQWTSSSVVAKRPRDASCLSLASLQ